MKTLLLAISLLVCFESAGFAQPNIKGLPKGALVVETRKLISPRHPNRSLVWLKDYNGDGKALEFGLFEAEACMGLQTTLIGYSEKQDRVIQYPVSLDVIEGSKHSNRVSPWADYLFSKKPLRPGYWKYEIDYRGHAGSLDKWEVRYNPTKERFEGKLIVIAGE